MKKKHIREHMKEFFKKNPDAMDSINPQEDGSLFSQELKDALSPFKKMNVKDCVQSVDFWKALCKHAGMSDEKFEEILNNDC